MGDNGDRTAFERWRTPRPIPDCELVVRQRPRPAVIGDFRDLDLETSVVRPGTPDVVTAGKRDVVLLRRLNELPKLPFEFIAVHRDAHGGTRER